MLTLTSPPHEHPCTAQELKDRVRAGSEPLYRGVSQRVIRLCGRTSDVTSLSLSRYGQHIVPVFESPEAVRALIAEHSRDFQRPMCVMEPSSPQR